MAYYQYAECGAYGHAWYVGNSSWKPMYGIPVTLVCERCSAERREAWTPSNGSIINRHYDYPMGYSFKGELRPTRDDFRKMLLSELAKPKRIERPLKQVATKHLRRVQ